MVQGLNAKVISPVSDMIFPQTIASTCNNIDISFLDNDKYSIFPGFCDVHVHFREPGFSYKETILSGSKAAAHGGYTDVCTMPNLNPVPDSVDALKIQQNIIDKDSVINIHPYGSITVEEKGEKLSDLDGIANGVIAFSDDGKGIQSDSLMRSAMENAKRLDKIIVAHCEDNSLLHGGYIHDGEYAKLHGHKGICSESEWRQIARDLVLAKETGCAYHVCHISTKESVDIIRKAKIDGVNVTCETAPHYLVMDDSYIQENGRFKMNPPIRSVSDREALIEGILDGTIDMIATDHAPHSLDEKSKGLEKSSFGIVGLETAFPILYTYLVEKNIISIEKILELLTVNPRRRFNIPFSADCYSIWDMNESYRISSKDFLSMGKATPFEDWEVKGKCLATVCNGKLVYIV